MNQFLDKFMMGILGYLRVVRIQAYQRIFADLAEHLSSLLDAGLPIEESIMHLRTSSRGAFMRNILTESIDVIRSGEPISKAWSPYVTPIFLGMLRSGEHCGQLSVILNKYALGWREQSKWQNRMIRMLSYPALLCILTIGLFIYISSTVIPMFNNMYVQLGYQNSRNIQLITFVLHAMPFWLLDTGFAVLVLLMILIGGSKHSSKVRSVVWQRVPFMRFIRLSRTRILSNHLALLLSSGLPIIHALRVVESSHKPHWLKDAAFRCRQKILLGIPLSQAFSGQMDTILTIFLHAAEKTGDLTGAFVSTELYSAERLKKDIERFTRVAEPALLLFMGCIVGLCMYAVFMPMYDFIGSISTSSHL